MRRQATRNSEFDLTVSFNDFLAAQRATWRAMTGAVTLTGRLTGRYRCAEGSGLFVNRGVLPRRRHAPRPSYPDPRRRSSTFPCSSPAF
jgi:hypothetical protein